MPNFCLPCISSESPAGDCEEGNAVFYHHCKSWIIPLNYYLLHEEYLSLIQQQKTKSQTWRKNIM